MTINDKTIIIISKDDLDMIIIQDIDQLREKDYFYWVLPSLSFI